MIGHRPRLLLALSAALLAVGGLMHAAAFGSARSAIAAAGLPAFYANSFKVLWLSDSATLIILAAAFGLIAARPAAAGRRVVVLLALVPAATAALLYAFVGNFTPAHMLAAAAAASALAGILPTARDPRGVSSS